MGALLAASAPDGPFRPRHGHAHQNQHDAVSHHERPAAVLGGQAGKTQKIAQPHGASGHGKNHSYLSGPLVLLRLQG